MPQILLKVGVYEGGGFGHKGYERDDLISNDRLNPGITEESIKAAHEALDRLINDYINGARGFRE